MDKEFLKFLQALMAASPQVVSSMMNDQIKKYIESLEKRCAISPTGKSIIMYMQKARHRLFTNYEVATAIHLGANSVGQSMRILVDDGYVIRYEEGRNTMYELSEKGKKVKITEKGEKNV